MFIPSHQLYAIRYQLPHQRRFTSRQALREAWPLV